MSQTSVFYSLTPTSQYFFVSSRNNVNITFYDEKIVASVATCPGTSTFSVTSQWLPVSLSSPTFTLYLNNSTNSNWDWNCNSGVSPNGHVYLSIVAVMPDGTSQTLTSIRQDELTNAPIQVQVPNNAQYVYIDWWSNGVCGLGIVPYGYCAAQLFPVKAVLSGYVPPPIGTTTFTVTVIDATTGLPVAGAKVSIYNSAYDYYSTAETNSAGVATISDVPYNPSAYYTVQVTASGYSPYTGQFSGSQLQQGVQVPLTPSTAPSKVSAGTVAAVVLGVIAAGAVGYLLYTHREEVKGALQRAYRGARSAAQSAYQRVRGALS